MPHVVRFTTAEGREGTHFTETLDDAVAFVERVRNVEEATDVCLFAMTEVPVTFKTYYQAQVAGVSNSMAPTAGVDPVVASVSPVSSISPVESDPVNVSETESSVLDTPVQDVQPEPSSSDADEQPSPPLESRFGESGIEAGSAPANGRRLFSRA